MKRILIKSGFFVLISITILGCSREYLADDTAIPVVPPVRISVMYFLDTSLAHPLDTVYKMYAQYDASYRPVSIYEYSFRNGDTTNTIFTNFAYNGTSATASRTTSSYKTFIPSPAASSDTVHYLYSNNICTGDSSREYRQGIFAGYFNHYYTYPSAPVIKAYTKRINAAGNATLIGWDTLRLNYSSGNIIGENDTTFISTNGDSVLTNYYALNATYTYTTNNNPLFAIYGAVPANNFSIAVARDVFGRGIQQKLLAGFEKTTSSWTPGNPLPVRTVTKKTYSYELNAQGNPATAFGKEYVVGSTDTSRIKIVFVY